MELATILAFGFFVGMGHALEADHLAALAAMNDRPGSRRQVVARGAVWGIGHSISLFAICGAVIVLGLTLTPALEATLELCVGVVIAALGLGVIVKLRAHRVHFHRHNHDGTTHFHAHSHAGDRGPHHKNAHSHRHPSRKTLRVLALGLLHGAAGSGGLLVLLVAGTKSIALSLAYVAIFGFGSVIGMAALSFVGSFPLAYALGGTRWLATSTMLAIGTGALWIGGSLAHDSAATLGWFGI